MLASVAEAIAREGGWISFARYMELALHGPQGYYTRAAPKLGPQGDFVTAPELGTLFGRTLARQLRALGFARILEVGAGSGALAESLLAEGPFEYSILETSPSLRAAQQQRLRGRAVWLDAPPRGFRGAIIANEVLDAMPVHAVAWREDGMFERGVALREGRLEWAEKPASGPIAEEAKAIKVPLPYESEIGLIGQAWVRGLGEVLDEGVALLIDYGFPGHEYYHPERSAGTLMCHHRHRAHAEVLAHPGEEDITAHVNFSAVARAAREGGLEVLGYATQAQFLVNCGITDVLGEVNAENALHYAPLAAQAQKLLSPAEMGELFKVLAVGRKVATPLVGFARGDRSHTL